MRDRSVGSVVVVDGDRTVGILTERDLVRWGAAGVDPGGVEGRRVDDRPTPTCVAPDLGGAGGLRLARVPRLPPHPRRRRRPPRRHRVDARPAAGGVDPARRAPVDDRGAARARGRRSSPRPTVGDVRGLEGFYHYRAVLGRRARGQAPARGRVVPAVRGPPADRRRSGRRSSTRSGRCARLPERVCRRCCRPSPAARRRSWRACAPRCRSSAPSRATGRPSTSTTPSAAATPCRCAPSIPTLITPIHRLKRGQEPIAPRTTSATAPTTCG